jgi:integrator complex subunit 11
MNPTNKPSNSLIDLVLISHFHLDHVGALPYFTEQFNYQGEVLMTTPTSAIVPYMLEDFRRVMNDVKFSSKNDRERERERDRERDRDRDRERSKDDESFIYTHTDIQKSISKIKALKLKETYHSPHGISIETYYAGHVLGACMFSITYRDLTVVYTGDFNSAADRHLGAAWIDRIAPHLLITESTYATTLRDNKRAREREFLK